MRLKAIEHFTTVEKVDQQVEQLSLDALSEKEKLAISAFKKAIRRRERGESDDVWEDD